MCVCVCVLAAMLCQGLDIYFFRKVGVDWVEFMPFALQVLGIQCSMPCFCPECTVYDILVVLVQRVEDELNSYLLRQWICL